MNDDMDDDTNDMNSDTNDETTDPLDQGEMRERRAGGRAGRRRSARPTVSTIYWRDIPAQLTARGGNEQHKVLLHARFQHAIDRAAGVAGLTSTDDYVQEWRTESSPLAVGDVSAQLDQRCAELEGEYPRDRLEAIVAAGGIDHDLSGDLFGVRHQTDHRTDHQSPTTPHDRATSGDKDTT